MSDPRSVVVLDVNETLSDMAPLAQRFTDVGAPGHLSRLWFASVLRDGFALTAAGAAAPFAHVARAALRDVLTGAGVADVDGGVEHVLAGFAALQVHPDVPEGLRRLREAGHRVVSLTNGSSAVSSALFERAGVRDLVEHVLSVEDAGAWKPAPAAYAHAADVCGAPVGDLVMVAVHPWDVDGAARAGLRTAWLDRAGAPYPDWARRPDVVVRRLPELAERLPAGR